MSKTRIGIDFDGTTADVNAVKSRWIESELGLLMEPWECNRTHCVPAIGEETYERMAGVVYEEASLMATPEITGFTDAIAGLRERDFELHLVSARPDDLLLVAKQWLRGKDLVDLFTDFHSSDGTSKDAICQRIGLRALVDDDERHLTSLSAEAILIQHGRYQPPLDLPEHVHFCSHWDAVSEVLTRLFR